MKKLIVTLTAITTLALVSAASGADEQQILFGGYWCKTSHKTKAIACVPMNGKGYSVGMARDVFIVFHNNKAIFSRRNK